MKYTVYSLLMFLCSMATVFAIESPADPFGTKGVPYNYPQHYEAKFQYQLPDVPEVHIDTSAIEASVRRAIEKIRAEEARKAEEWRKQKAAEILKLQKENTNSQVDVLDTFLFAEKQGLTVAAEDMAVSKKEMACEKVLRELPQIADAPMIKASDALLKYLELSMDGSPSKESLTEFVEQNTKPVKATEAVDDRENNTEPPQEEEPADGSERVSDDDSDERPLESIAREVFTLPPAKGKEDHATEEISGPSNPDDAILSSQKDEAYEAMLSFAQESMDEIVVQGHSSTNALAEILDKKGYAASTIKTVQQVEDMRDMYKRAEDLYKEHGRDVSFGYLMFRTAGKVAEFVGGTFSAPAQAYLEVGAKTMETGVNAFRKAQVRSGYIEAGKKGTTANEILLDYGKVNKNGASLDVTDLAGTTTSLDIASWKSVEIDGRKAWIPCDENFEPYPYIFVDKPAGILGFFKKKEAHVFKADVKNLDEGEVSWDESEKVLYR